MKQTQRKSGFAKPLAELIEECLNPVLAAQGFASTDIVIGWPEIAGERLAARSEPIKIEWPRRRHYPGQEETAEPATLVIRVESAFALEVQHLAPVLIERVNARYGYRCIGKIVLKQGPVRRAPPRPGPKPFDPAIEAAMREKLPDFSDDGLREAVVRLGAGILTDARARKD
jgi:hypothetical protein